MNLLLLSNLYPTPRDPTRGVFTAQIARALAARCELRVVVPLPWFPRVRWAHRLLPYYAQQFGAIPPTATCDGVPVWYPRYPLLPRLSERMHPSLMALGTRPTVTRLNAKAPFDVINAHWLYPDGVAAVAIGRSIGVPVVLTALGCDVNDFLDQRPKRQAILGALSECAAVTCVSPALAERLLHEGVDPRKITVIGNGVDTQRFFPMDRTSARQRLGLAAGSPLVVCIARLSPEKGVQHLVEAAVTLAAARPDVRIVVLGDGPDAAALREQAERLGVAPYLSFSGTVPHERVSDWLAASDVVCLPSLREGNPNAVNEALASGRPVVASRVGSLPDLVSADRGLLVTPGVPSELAWGLLSALERSWDPSRIAAPGRLTAWSTVADRYLELFQGCVGKRTAMAMPEPGG